MRSGSGMLTCQFPHGRPSVLVRDRRGKKIHSTSPAFQSRAGKQRPRSVYSSRLGHQCSPGCRRLSALGSARRVALDRALSLPPFRPIRFCASILQFSAFCSFAVCVWLAYLLTPLAITAQHAHRLVFWHAAVSPWNPLQRGCAARQVPA